MTAITRPFAALAILALLSPLSIAEPPPATGKTRPLFDGSTLDGWEGNPKLWRVQDGALTGGSHTETVAQNDRFMEGRIGQQPTTFGQN